MTIHDVMIYGTAYGSAIIVILYHDYRCYKKKRQLEKDHAADIVSRESFFHGLLCSIIQSSYTVVTAELSELDDILIDLKPNTEHNMRMVRIKIKPEITPAQRQFLYFCNSLMQEDD